MCLRLPPRKKRCLKGSPAKKRFPKEKIITLNAPCPKKDKTPFKKAKIIKLGLYFPYLFLLFPFKQPYKKDKQSLIQALTKSKAVSKVVLVVF